MTRFNAANSEFNKDKNWGKLTPTSTTSRIEFSEARMIGEKSDDGVTIYCSATDIGEYQFKKKDEKWVESLVKFNLYKRPLHEEKIFDSKAMAFIIKHIAEKVGYNKPFSGWINLQIPETLCDALLTGKAEGRDLSELEMTMLSSSFVQVKPLELAPKLEGKEMPEPSYTPGGKYNAAPKGQTKLEMLNDRMTFMKAMLQPGSALEEILKLSGSPDTPSDVVRVWIVDAIH